MPKLKKLEVLNDLNIEAVINAVGSKTELGGTIIEEQAAKAMAEISQYHVDVPLLVANIEGKIAQLLDVESICLCAGSSAGISMAAAACIAGNDQHKIKALPNAETYPNTFLAFEAHRNRFDHAIKIAGGNIRYIAAEEEILKKQLSDDKVVGVYYTLAWFCDGPCLPIATTAALAHQYHKPLIVDAAAQVPPITNFSRFVNEGADMVIFSGGKTIRGPQDAGFIVGKKEWTEYCKLQANPNIESIGRGMKVTKEDAVGLWYALKLYTQRNHKEDQRIWNDQLQHIKDAIQRFSALHTSILYPFGPGYQVPYLSIHWKHEDMDIKAKALLHQLAAQSPPIHLRLREQTTDSSTIWIYAHTLKAGEEKIIATSLIEMLNNI